MKRCVYVWRGRELGDNVNAFVDGITCKGHRSYEQGRALNRLLQFVALKFIHNVYCIIIYNQYTSKYIWIFV